MLALLLRTRSRSIYGTLRAAGWAQGAVIGVFAIIGIALMVGAYLFFEHGFSAILFGGGEQDAAGPLIARYLFEASFALVFFLGSVSALASAPGLFYRSDDLPLLLSLPISPRTVFAYRFVAALAASSWPVLLVASPALAAYGAVAGAGPGYAVIAVAIALVCIVATALTGALLSFALAPLSSRLPTASVWLVEAALFTGAGLWLARQVVPRGVFTLLQAETAADVAASTRALDTAFGWLPSHPLAMAALGAVDAPADAWLTLLGVAVVLAIAFVALGALVGVFYLPLWQAHGEHTFTAGPFPGRAAGYRDTARAARRTLRASFPRIFRLGNGFLLEKDLLMLLRDGTEMARAGFLGFLLLVLVVAMRTVASMPVFARPDLLAVAVASASAAIGYFGVTFCLRFVFPAFTMERRGAWALLSSPMHAHEAFSWKYFFWSAVLVVLMDGATASAAIAFGLAPALGAAMLFVSTLSAVTIVVITLGQGTLYPGSAGRSPDEVATSPSGLAATVICLAYVWLMARYVEAMTVAVLLTGAVPTDAPFGALIVSIGIIGGYWWLSARRLDETDSLA